MVGWGRWGGGGYGWSTVATGAEGTDNWVSSSDSCTVWHVQHGALSRGDVILIVHGLSHRECRRRKIWHHHKGGGGTEGEGEGREEGGGGSIP